MREASVVSVHIGRVAPLGEDQEPSAFVKHPVDGPILAGMLGFAGDEQADLSVHGGPEKALYGYAADHYPAWSAEFPQHSPIWGPGAVGENLAIAGMTEADICVGDIHRIGGALLQVCQPRQPCFKFALRFDNPKLPKAMVRTGRSGWYYRVLEPGEIRASDRVQLAERPNPDFPFTRLVALVNHGEATREELEHMAIMPGLASQWREHARVSLERSGSA